MIRLLFVLLLAGLWFLLSGHTEWYIIALGAVSVAITAALASRMRLVDRESMPLDIMPRLPRYFVWLGVEIVRSNIAIARCILNPRLRVAPSEIRLQTPLRSDVARVCLANSITLTPGTVTLGVGSDELLVHALTREAAQDLEGGEMTRRVAHVEGPR